jgi:pimeloyl-ACP methyl ester carboxylesterase
MGGALVAQVAYDFPSRVDKLILEAAAVYLRPPAFENIFEWIPRSVARGLVGLYSGHGMGVKVGMKNAYGEPAHLDSESVRVRIRPMRVRGSVDALLAMVESPRESDLPDEVSQIQHPTLILWGGRDRVVPLKYGRRLRNELPNSRLVILPTAGHLPHEEFPAEVNKVITLFLDEGLEGLKKLEEVNGQDT